MIIIHAMTALPRLAAAAGGHVYSDSGEEDLRASRHPVKSENLASVAPLIRAHAIPTRSYDLPIRWRRG